MGYGGLNSWLQLALSGRQENRKGELRPNARGSPGQRALIVATTVKCITVAPTSGPKMRSQSPRTAPHGRRNAPSLTASHNAAAVRRRGGWVKRRMGNCKPSLAGPSAEHPCIQRDTIQTVKLVASIDQVSASYPEAGRGTPVPGGFSNSCHLSCRATKFLMPVFCSTQPHPPRYARDTNRRPSNSVIRKRR
jgi:hypothetical protein